jgi:hypothetical protein
LDNLSRDWPELLPSYEWLYAGRAYLPDTFVKPRRDRVRALARAFEIADRRVVRLAPAPESTADEGVERLTLILAAEVESRVAA